LHPAFFLSLENATADGRPTTAGIIAVSAGAKNWLITENAKLTR